MIKRVYTLEEIDRRRAALRSQIKGHEASLRRRWQTTFQSPPAESKWQGLVNKADAAFSIYDGFMMGLKVFRRVRRWFR